MHRLQDAGRTQGAPDWLNSTALEVCPDRQPVYRGRFAPSPTGPLHLGSLFTALAGYLEARSRGGQWLLRIDDADPYRTQASAADKIQSSLEALGLFWDGPVYFQSRQADRYQDALSSLRAHGQIYACGCSRKDLAETARTIGPQIYPGYCRHKYLTFIEGAHALRVVTENLPYGFDDRVQGHIEQDLSRTTGDFVLYRRDGAVAYHLATVLDDAEQNVNDVLRGFDLLDSTPGQIYLQHLLDLPEPGYAHIPILLDASGLKLSKQTSAAEADTRQPNRLLYRLLILLKQSPPAELQTAPAGEILDWATTHWRLSALNGQQHITVATA